MSLFDDVPHIINENEDLISQISKFISSSTKTSSTWAEAVATSMLSTVMGPKRYISNVIGKLNLNVWYMCIGPSGLAKKTVPLKNYLFPIIARVGQNEHLILSNRFSIEGFIKYFPEDGTGTIIRDEFTGLLKESSSKDYVTDLLEFLSELYDGTVQKRATVTHEINEIKHCYITFITATTPYLYKIMRPEFYTQGTGNRILVELFSIDNVPDDCGNPEDFFRGQSFDKLRDDFINEVSNILADLRVSNVRNFHPDDEAAKLWTDFEAECRQVSKRYYKTNMYDLHYSYLARSAEMALKLSALYNLSRRWNIALIEDAPQIFIIEKQDMQRAIDKAKYHYHNFCTMLEQWRARPEMKVATTLDEQANYIIDIINNTPGINWKGLRQNARWDTYTWHEVLKFLFQTEKILVGRGFSGAQGGRRPILFFDGNNTECLKSMEQIKDWTILEQSLNLK